jgi:sulfur-carrier protein adenylyltransferase/sulfurtransferase
MKTSITEIEAYDLQDHIGSKNEGDYLLVDVRTPREYENGHIPGARLIPLDELEHRLDELPPSGELIFYCHSGIRSRSAALLSHASGHFDRAAIANLKGGFSEYEGMPLTGYPKIRSYPGGGLRKALLWAMDMEKGADRVYAELAKGTSPLEATFGRLAALERAHARIVYEMLSRREQLPPFAQAYAQLRGDLVEGGEPVEEIVSRMRDRGCLEAAELAMEIETMAYDLYRNLAEREDMGELRAALLALAEAEKDHIRVLARLFKSCG